MTDKEDKTSLPLDSDKNLLILAAKVYFTTEKYGYVTNYEYRNSNVGVVIDLGAYRGAITRYWNPLTNNYDCFRLETALSIDITWMEDRIIAADFSSSFSVEYFADHNGDKDKARRYASTRAAALRYRSKELEEGRE